ncbi:MAG: ABC transporter ATP-binding protein [Bacillota bacterium]|nr:ABC transporter ATP-binding protein [Bacillota bacterium]
MRQLGTAQGAVDDADRHEPGAEVAICDGHRHGAGAEVAIRIEGLSKRFGQVKALDGLSLSVPTGKVCGFIGPNGAGKTTTMRILLGLLPRDAGTVRILGEDAVFGKELGVRSRMAYLPENPVFPEKHTGLEVMDLVAGLYRLDPRTARKRAQMLLGEFHLEKASRRSVGTYSRGMKQRLGLAACFLPEPEVMILDEPVSVLDPEGRVEVFDILTRLKGKSTVLFSSHILEDVERVSDTLVMIKGGRKVAEGPMEELLSRFAADRLKVRFRPDHVARGKDVLAGFPWVERVSDGAPPGTVLVDVRPAMMDEALQETAFRLAGEGLRVMEYSRVRTDLETVFLRLTGGQPPTAR